jgi:hypothetical protein
VKTHVNEERVGERSLYQKEHDFGTLLAGTRGVTWGRTRLTETIFSIVYTTPRKHMKLGHH